jgi:uncharacterized protein YndB with AHSA1/START domain
MTVRIRVGTTVDAPPQQVWDVVEAIEHHTEWMADAVRITFVSAHRRGIGTTFDCLTRVGPLRTTDRMTITEWEPGRSMGIEHHGVVTGRGRFTLKPRRNGQTRFAWNERLQFPWWMGGPVGERVAKPILRRVWRGNLTRLRNIVENT